MSQLRSPAELREAVRAACTFWLIVCPAPFARLRGGGGWCDGVPAFSPLWALTHYLGQLASGRAAVTAPAHTLNGAGGWPHERLHALWNAETMDAILPRAAAASVAARPGAQPRHPRHFWVTPTVGGHVSLRHLLRFSLPWAREQWHNGYAHAAALDEARYWEGLAPRRAAATDAAPAGVATSSSTSRRRGRSPSRT